MRLPWADRVRVTVIAGVVVVHAAATYLVNTGWYYQELTDSKVVPLIAALPLGLAAIYGLAPLFLIAGVLARVSLAKRGAAGFARSRLVRLGVPLLVYVLVVDPVSGWLGGGTSGTLGEMWFVVALLVFSLLYATRPLPLSPLTARLVLTVAVLVAAADFLVWLRWSYTDDTPWNLNWTHWPQAAGVFALGALVGPDAVTVRFGRWCGWAAIALLGMVLALWATAMSAGRLDAVAGGWQWTTALFAVLDGATALTLSVWLAAWCRRRWNQPPGGVMARAARGSFAAYVLHPPVLVLLSLGVRSIPWSPELKFVLVAAIGVPASFVAGYLVTLLPGARRIM